MIGGFRGPAGGLAEGACVAHESVRGEVRGSTIRDFEQRSAYGGCSPAAAALCPIFFAKDAQTGEFYVGAMFGFQAGELLVEGADRRDALFRPLDLQRQGFFVSDENIAVDLAHPRFGEGASIRLFEEDGQPTEPMRRVQWALG